MNEKCKNKDTGIEVEIIGIEPIENGIQVFARSWKNGAQLGFGEDSSIDIERFRFINLPELVEDPFGPIEISAVDFHPVLGRTVIKKRARKDIDASLRIHLLDAARITGKESANIESGKVGNTTVTIFGVSGAIGTIEGPNNATYATIHDASVGQASNGDVNVQNEVFGGSYLIMRAPLIFDTSSIPSGSSISSAIYSIFPTGVTRSGDGSSATIVSFTGSTSAITVNDYDKAKWGTTSGGATLLSAMSAGAYRDITLNATGIGYLTLGGVSGIGLRDSGDINSTVPGGINARLASSESAGNPSKLTITYTAPVGGFAPIPTLLLMNVG